MNIHGDPNDFPNELPLLDDGTPPDAAEINVPIEALADRTAYLFARLFTASLIATVTLSGTVEAPANAVAAFLVGCGGGGGGGGGSAAGGDARSCGGGGGGGARKQIAIVPVVGGEDYTVEIGGGGVGGAGSGDRSPGGFASGGASGGATTFTRAATSTVLATFRGARGGKGGITTDGAGAGQVTFAPGGPDVQIDLASPPNNLSQIPFYAALAAPSRGAPGITAGIEAQATQNGGSSPEGYAGGSSGVPDDTVVGSFYGGGAGGGGGAGPYGDGGGGGSGSAPNSGGAATNGGDGNHAGVSAGGAGGGGCGGANADGGVGGNGGNGGDGQLTIIWLLGAETP